MQKLRFQGQQILLEPVPIQHMAKILAWTFVLFSALKFKNSRLQNRFMWFRGAFPF
jgi:hypothetical protein